MRIDEFTYEQKQIIDDICKRNFENLTADEVKLYADWQAAIALRDAEFQAKQDALAAESAARIKALDSKAKTARKNLNDLKAAALARLERIDNGK